MLVVRLGVGDFAPVRAEDAEIVGRRDERGTVFEDVGMSLDEGDAEVDRFSVGLSGVVAAGGPCREIARMGQRAGQHVLQETVVGVFAGQPAIDCQGLVEEFTGRVKMFVPLLDDGQIAIRLGQFGLIGLLLRSRLNELFANSDLVLVRRGRRREVPLFERGTSLGVQAAGQKVLCRREIRIFIHERAGDRQSVGQCCLRFFTLAYAVIQ